MNPTHSYILDTSKLTIDKRYGQQDIDVFGNLSVTVKNKETSKYLFSFTIAMETGHGKVMNLTSGISSSKESLQHAVDKMSLLMPLTSQESLKLLLKQKPLDDDFSLYALYPKLIQDNEARLQTLEKLSLLPPGTVTEVHNNLLIHLLDNLSWNDSYIVRKATKLLLKLAPLFAEIIGKYEFEVLEITDQLDENDISNLKLFRNLKFLDARLPMNLIELPLVGLVHLKRLDITGSNISSLRDLNQCTSLEWLNVSKTTKLFELSLAGLVHLKVLHLFDSGVSSLRDLNQCTSLEWLNAYNTNNLTELSSLAGLIHLKRLDISDSKISSLPDLNQCTSLEWLSVGFTKKLPELSLTGLTNLKLLNISHTNISSLRDLNQCTSLEWLNVSKTTKLFELSLEGLNNLKKLDISNALVQKLIGLDNLVPPPQIIGSIAKSQWDATYRDGGR